MTSGSILRAAVSSRSRKGVGTAPCSARPEELVDTQFETTWCIQLSRVRAQLLYAPQPKSGTLAGQVSLEQVQERFAQGVEVQCRAHE
jgi:hypothetical protein